VIANEKAPHRRKRGGAFKKMGCENPVPIFVPLAVFLSEILSPPKSEVLDFIDPDNLLKTLKHGGVILFQGHETTCGDFRKGQGYGGGHDPASSV
jgi:hypothetical protein